MRASLRLLRAHRRLAWAGVGLLLLLLGGLVLDRLFPLPLAPQYSPLVLAQDGTVLHAYLNPTQKIL